MSPRCKVWQQVEGPEHQELEDTICKRLFFLLCGFSTAGLSRSCAMSPCSHAVAKSWDYRHLQSNKEWGRPWKSWGSATFCRGEWHSLGAGPPSVLQGRAVLPVPPMSSCMLRWGDRERSSSSSEQAVTELTASSSKLRFKRLIQRWALWKCYLED